MIGIYKIESILKPKRIYIGSTKDIGYRWSMHLYHLSENKHCNNKLQNHYNKYGKEDLRFSLLVECKEEDLLKIEQVYLDSLNPWFNICKIAGRTTGYRHSEETKKKMRKPKTKEHRRKLSEAKKGKKTGRPPVNSGFKKGYTPWNKGKTIKRKPNKTV